MNKKYLMFGVLGLFAMAIVSAVLVDYLSNTIQADVTVASPMEQLISKTNSDYSESAIIMNSYGGEVVTFWTKTKNLANTAITGNGENIVTNLGIMCADFDKIEARTWSNGVWNPSNGSYYDITTSCAAVDGHINQRQFGYGSTPITWEAGQIDTTEIKVTFKSNAIGTYEFTSQIVPVLA